MADEPDIIQKLSVDFNVVNDISVDLTSEPQAVDAGFVSDAPVNAEFNSNEAINTEFAQNVTLLEAQFGTIYVVSGDSHILYATTATWNSQPTLISDQGYIYIYSDYKKDEQDKDIAGIKVGDGKAYLIDMPFTDEILYEHLADDVRHITQREREFWNNKVSCYISEVQGDNLIFTTQ